VRTLIAENRSCEPREILLSASAPDCARDARGGLLGFLSISHCGNTLVVAVSRQVPLGVDCERLKPKRDWLGIARGYFSTREASWLASAPPEAAAQLFLRSWTCKEALAKCSARELGQVLKQAEILRDRISLPDSLKQYRCWSGALTPELMLALAAKPVGNSPGEIACRFRPAIARANYQPAAFLQRLMENAD
jgi:4'-phosphopantetheinyl transferase